MRHSARKMPMRSERPKRGTEAGQSSAIFFQLFIVLLGIGPRERSSVGNALGQRSFGDECNVGRKYVRAVRSKIDP